MFTDLPTQKYSREWLNVYRVWQVISQTGKENGS